MKSEDRQKKEMDKEIQHLLVKDSHSRQVKDPYYEKNLRVLQQVQEKRATLLGFHGQDELTLARIFDRGNVGSQNEASLEPTSKGPYYSTPPPVQFSSELALTNDAKDELVKPEPRHVSFVRPVQYPDRKICHPVPQALRRPPDSSPAYRGDSRHLPPKKRPYISAQEDVVPSSQVGGMATLDHSETSTSYKFLPQDVRNEYFQQLRNKKARLASEDQEMTGVWNPNAVQNSRSISIKELHNLTNGIIEDDAELDREVTKIFSPTPELKSDYCHSPKEPWIPNIADDVLAEIDKSDHDMTSFTQKITPVIISLSPGNSRNSPITISSSRESSQSSPITISSSPRNSPSSPITVSSSPGNSPSCPVIISPSPHAMTDDLIDDNVELDKEVAAIFSPTPEFKFDYCQSPKEPWIPNVTDDIIAETNRQDQDMMNFFQKISPVIVCLSPRNSPSSPVTVHSSPDNNNNSQTPVSSSQGNSLQAGCPSNQPFLENLSTIVSSSNITTDVNNGSPTYPEPGIVITDHLNAISRSENDSSNRPKSSMEELHSMISTTATSTDRQGLDKFIQTEEEQFADLLEEFLEENTCLPPEIQDVRVDMHNQTRDTAAQQKEGILYTADTFMWGSDNKSSVTGFDRAADDDVMLLINEIDLPDQSPEDVFIEFLDSMDESLEGTLFTTEVFMKAEDERLLEEFERATEGGLLSEGITPTELSAPTVNNTADSPKRKFEEIKFVDVEMESTGQGIYDEIADFFGYDGYTDYASTLDKELLSSF